MEKQVKIIGGFTLLYVFVFLINAIRLRNYEFIYYVAIMLIFIWLIIKNYNKLKFSTPLLWALSIWGLLHMAGGNIIIAGDVLYKFWFIPIEIGAFPGLKYDMVIHLYGFAVATFTGLALLNPLLKKPIKGWKMITFLVIIIGLGFGALNELAEFIATIIIPDTNVGGYNNTGWDLVFNAIGSCIAGFMIYRRK